MNTRKRRKWSLAVLLSLVLMMVATIPVAIVSLFAAIQFVPRMEAQTERRQLQLVETLNGQVSRYFAMATRELTTISNLLPLNIDRRSSNDLLDAFVVSSDFYEALYQTDESGRVIAIGLPTSTQNGRGNHLGQDFSQRDFYRAAQHQRSAVWSDSFLSPVSGHMTVAIAQPAGSGMLIGEVGIAPLPEFARRLVENTTVQVMLLDRQDQLVAHSSNLFANQQLSLANLPVVVNARTNGPQRLQTFEFNGTSMVGSASPVPGLDWLVVAAQSQSDAYAQVNSLWTRIQIAVAIALLSALVVALLMARLLTRSFERYARLAQAIGDSRYDYQIPESEVREFAQLQGNLARMGATIDQREQQMRQARDDLAELNATLEARVEERTDELTRANTELVATLDTLQRTQSDLQRAEKLASLGAMVAGVAHELNTPIGNALMAISTLDLDIAQLNQEIESGQPRRSVLVGFVQRSRTANALTLRSLNRAGELIASFKQVAVSSRDLPRARFKINDMLTSVLSELSLLIEKNHIRIEIQVDDAARIDSYPAPVAQILTHLISNAAIHAFDNQGERVISIVANVLPKGSVRLLISDNGRGIPAEHLPRLFDPFFTTRLGQGGSGLGLYVVHNLVTQILGGSIQVSSMPGEGTHFDLILPETAPAPPSHGTIRS